MDNGFEKLKQEIETELGRPIDQSEEIVIKGLYHFGKGVKLKNQVESEPQHISEILPGVMRDIQKRRETALCRNGCDRPSIKSRPVCAECHRADMRKNYYKRKAEHEEWRQRQNHCQAGINRQLK